MSKPNAKPFDDAGEIQVVPIDTVVGDGEHDLEVNDSCKNQSQGSRVCGPKCKDVSKSSRPQWREPDIVA